MRVYWRKQAANDVREAIEYLGARSPAAALKTSQAIRQKVRKLKEQPSLGRPGRVAETRELVIGGTPYIVIYTVDMSAQMVIILRVLHGAQLWPEDSDK